MERGTLMQFTGEGHGVMGGVTEYLVYTTEEDINPEEHAAPGFTLAHSESVVLPDWMPEESTLVVC